MTASASTAQTFLALLVSLDAYFAAETIAVSVETEHFGTLSREDVARLLPMARETVAILDHGLPMRPAQAEEPQALPETADDAATVSGWSDRYSYTIVSRSPSGKTIQARQDTERMVSGSMLSERQRYEFFANPKAPVETFTLRKNGAYVLQGEPIARGCTRLSVGRRSAYRDPSF